MATGRTGANIPHVQCPVEEEFKPVLGSATTPLRHTVAKIVSGRAKTSDNATIFRVQVTRNLKVFKKCPLCNLSSMLFSFAIQCLSTFS